MKKAAAYLLIAIGVIMIYLSVKANILPPGLTGLGFLAIAMVFLGKK